MRSLKCKHMLARQGAVDTKVNHTDGNIPMLLSFTKTDDVGYKCILLNTFFAARPDVVISTFAAGGKEAVRAAMKQRWH